MTVPGRGGWTLINAVRAKWNNSAPSLNDAFRAFWTATDTRIPVLSQDVAAASPLGPYAVFAVAGTGTAAKMTGRTRDTENHLQQYLLTIHVHAKASGGKSAMGVAAVLATAVAAEFDSRERRLDPSPDQLVTSTRQPDVMIQEGDDGEIASITLAWILIVDCVFPGPPVS